ncbi:MAG: DsrE/DsrF/DrsH-like family protein, partial [Thermodesulfobacteriota bacterium]
MEDIQKQIEEMKTRFDRVEKKIPSNKISMIVFSGDLDKALAAFVIATGSVAMGLDVIMFFTFWGIPMLRDKAKNVSG